MPVARFLRRKVKAYRNTEGQSAPRREDRPRSAGRPQSAVDGTAKAGRERRHSPEVAQEFLDRQMNAIAELAPEPSPSSHGYKCRRLTPAGGEETPGLGSGVHQEPQLGVKKLPTPSVFDGHVAAPSRRG